MIRHSIARIIHAWLASRAEQHPAPVPIFYHTRPASPASCLAIMEAEGNIHGRGHKTGKTHESHGIKVSSRFEGEGAADAARYGIFWVNSQLQGPDFKGSTVTIEETTYTLHAAHQYGTITSLGLPDKTKQALYTQDYQISLQGV